MTTRQFDDQHYAPNHVVDFEMAWIVAFSAVVVASGFFALSSIAQ
jgi:hypothetical protein